MSELSALLTIISALGRIVRATPTGPWTSRYHRWEPVERCWPDGLPELAAERLAARTGPALARPVRPGHGQRPAVVDRLEPDHPQARAPQASREEVDLHGNTGIGLVDDNPGDAAPTPPSATLLPALDPTSMGWKQRDWLFGIPQHHVFDNRGNIGPTLWWDGEIIGSWAVDATGQIRTIVVADRGAAARTTIQDAAARLEARLQGTAATPAIRTPLERQLAKEIADTPEES